MGVRFEQGRERGFLLCDNEGCTARSAFYRVLPDDPTGSVVAQANHEEGWGSAQGFLIELVGNLTYCQDCLERGDNIRCLQV
jgi:hypothetical protein